MSLSFAGFVFVPSGPGGSPYAQLRQSTHAALYTVEVQIVGNHRVPEAAIRAALPKGGSIPWWRNSQSLVSSALLGNPQIESVHVSSCQGRWDCFVVRVEERGSSYLSLTDEGAWIISKDGSFMEPVKSVKNFDDAKIFAAAREQPLVLIKGVITKDMSPDAARGRVLYLNNAIPVIESELGRKVETIEMRESGELQVRLNGLPFPSIFDYAGSDMSLVGNRARRLALLLTRFQGKTHLISTVDLAFDKLAVVKLVN